MGADGEEALVVTVVECNGKKVQVRMTEEEMFIALLGAEEYEKRKAAAYYKDWGGPPPPPPEPAPVEKPKKRFISLGEK